MAWLPQPGERLDGIGLTAYLAKQRSVHLCLVEDLAHLRPHDDVGHLHECLADAPQHVLGVPGAGLYVRELLCPRLVNGALAREHSPRRTHSISKFSRHSGPAIPVLALNLL